MAEDAVDPGLRAPLLEALERRGVVVRRPPRARALREDLDRVAADRLDAIDGRVDAAGRRDVSPELHDAYDSPVPPVVRFAPSPTGFLHIGGVHTALFNWLFARHEGGEFRLRIENTDTSREVVEAVQQIQDSLSWLGLDWDGEVTFQLDRMEHCRQEAERLVAEGKAYEDEGAIRMRMPDEGVTAWDDLIRGQIEYPSEKLEDVVIVRADGRPTYNFASPVEDWLDGITHVLRGDDHISNTPKQIRILEALGAPLPAYGHFANILGDDGKKLSKRHGAISAEEFRREGYLPDALVNFLALLGWSYDDKTTIMSRDELIERFTLERVGSSPADVRLREARLAERCLPAGSLARGVRGHAARLSPRARPGLGRGARPRCSTARPGEDRKARGVSELRRLPVRDVELDATLVDGSEPVLAAAEDELESLEPYTAETIEAGLRGLAERLELKPRAAFEPIRIAVTGSKVSPGLFESLELLGREKSVERIRSARAAAV